MDILGTKTFGEKEDEEVERLVRPLPKKKPPRKDRRREETQAERDPDVEGDPDLKGDPDLSMNYKTIGGSMVDRVARRFMGRDPKMISVRHRDTGRVVQVSEETLKEESSKYEKLEEAEEDPKGDALRDLAKDKPQLQSILKDLTNPKSDLGGLAEGNPDLPASVVLKGVQLPEGIKTLGDAVKALRAKPAGKPKPGKPKAEAPKAEAPKAEDKPEAPKEEAPKAEDKPEAPAKPKSAADFPPPQREPPTEEETLEAMDLVHSTALPPGMRAKLLTMHPADVKEVLASFNSFNSLDEPKNLKKEIESAGKNFVLDPTKVTSLPTKVKDKHGEEQDFDSLSEEEQAKAVQDHRNAVVAASMASQMRVTRSMVSSGIPEYVAAKLSFLALSTASHPPEVRAAKAKEAARSAFTEAATGFSGKPEEDVDERFGSVIQRAKRKLLGDEDRKKYLAAVKKLDPHTQMAAVAHLQGEDYKAAFDKFLDPKSKDRISEFDDPEKISRKISTASESIRKAGRHYPAEARSALPDPSMVFRVRVRRALRDLAPEKAKVVAKAMLEADADAYDKAMVDYKEDEKVFRKAYKEYEREYQAWEKAKKKHEAQQAKGGPYRTVEEPFDQDPPEPPLGPEPPRKPVGYETVRKPSKREREEIQAQLDEVRGRRVASLYSSYRCQKWQMGTPMPSADQMRQAVRTAIYHGVQPYPKDHEGFAPYPEWHQAHQRDLGPNDFGVILKAAQDWLKSPVLSTAVEGMVPDARFRAALDLAIQNSEDGKYNRAIHPALYNMLLAKLSDQPEEGTLLTVREAKTAGFSYAVDTIQVLFVPARKPVPFNIDTINAINRTWIPTEGDDGEEHEVNLKVVDTRGGGFLTFHQEKAGYRVETLVWVQVPESDIDKAFKALQDVGKKHGFKVEKAHSGTKPGVRKVSSTEETAEGNVMTVKFAKSDANKILGRLDKIAGHIQENYAKWGMDFETAKGIVNDLDRTADEIEKAAFGEDSLASRQVELLKAAKVIQQDSDEGYMGTYNAPTAPHQTDSDEPYMGLYKDDQTQGVQTGKSTTGRPLAP